MQARAWVADLTGPGWWFQALQLFELLQLVRNHCVDWAPGGALEVDQVAKGDNANNATLDIHRDGPGSKLVVCGDARHVEEHVELAGLGLERHEPHSFEQRGRDRFGRRRAALHLCMQTAERAGYADEVGIVVAAEDVQVLGGADRAVRRTGYAPDHDAIDAAVRQCGHDATWPERCHERVARCRALSMAARMSRISATRVSSCCRRWSGVSLSASLSCSRSRGNGRSGSSIAAS